MADNLLDKASILLTPTAYNNGSMLSVKPENGDGDFTFSRGSAATRVNAQGLVENVQIISSELVSNGDFSQEGSELITNGDFATDSDWSKGTGWSIGDGVATHTGSQSLLAQYNIITIGKSYRISFDLTNADDSNYVRLISSQYPNGGDYKTDGTHVVYTSTNIAHFWIYGIGDVTIDNVSVKEVGQDWSLETGWSIGDGVANCINGSGVSIYQTNAVDVGKQYKLTFNVSNYSQGWLETVGGFTSGVLAEADGYYEVYGTAASTTFGFSAFGSFNGSITNISVKEITDDTDLPRIDYTDGCGSWLLEPQSTNLYLNSETLSTQSNATSASTYTVSFYGTGTITFSGTHTGTLVGTGANDRVSATFTTTSGTLTSTISGNCEKGQLEQQSYATSYIPTDGAIATRLADVANNSGNSTLINSTEGVLYAEIAALSDDVLADQRSIQIEGLNGSSNNEIIIQYISGDLRFLVYGNSTLQLNTSQSVSLSSYTKVALLYKNNVFKIYINGTERYNVSGSYIMPTNLNKLNFSRSGVSNFFGKAKAVAVYKEALTDAELQSLTTI